MEEEKIKIQKIIEEVLSKKGTINIDEKYLSILLDYVAYKKHLDMISSEVIEYAIKCAEKLPSNHGLVEEMIYVLSQGKTNQFSNIAEYVADFENLKKVLIVNLWNEKFSLDGQLLKINPVLYNLTEKYQEALKIIKSQHLVMDLFLSLYDSLNKMFILFLLNPSDYEYKYELLPNAIKKIINNFGSFLNDVTNNFSYAQTFDDLAEKEAAQILFIKEILDTQYRETIESTKKA